jgi:dTDP-4-amino-4,6-dideoxygalactose transaminase
MGRTFGGKEGDCPVTESASDRLLRLPFYNSMGEADLERAAQAVTTFPG